MIPPRPPELGPQGNWDAEWGGHLPLVLQLACWASPRGGASLGCFSLNLCDGCPPTPPPFSPLSASFLPASTEGCHLVSK